MRASSSVPHIFAAIASLGLAFCAEADTPAAPQPAAGYGPNPQLPAPRESLIPTLNIAPATGWKNGATPRAGRGFRVAAFAGGLDHPRWLYVLPNGDVLVAETNRPPRETSGLRSWVQKQFMARAGANTPSANRITLLRDANNDGVAETKTVFLRNLFSPFGMALVGNDFYVANADAIVRFPYTQGATSIAAPGVKVAALPAGRNHHWTKSLLASRDGRRLYVGVGSNSNVGDNGMNEEVNRAAILEVDRASGRATLFAGGLRNPVGLAWHPTTGELWTVVNERDELGDDLVPDYMTHVQRGAFYGWPYSYYGQHVDTRVEPPRPDLVAKAIKPDYALGAHTASLGLTFYTGDALPARYKGGAFIGQHGSWNRSVPAGYRVIFVPFRNGRPSGMPEEVLTGFLDREGNAQGRPVGVAVDKSGAILVADDVGNVIWRVTSAGPTAMAR
jgi:glucose/arabinose dehydrogenase